MDIYSPAKRSEVMSKVRAANTAPEMVVRRILHALGYRFRLHRKDVPGRPDITLKRRRTIVFVHGCFWHHHRNCPKSRFPMTNRRFWKDKILQNVRRDRKVIASLRQMGWRVLVIWECDTKSAKVVNKLRKFMTLASRYH